MLSRPTSDVRRLASAYRAQLVRRFGARLLDVVVFGSRARGDAELDSDLDVAVVIRDLSEEERTEAVKLGYRTWCDAGRTGPILAPLVTTEHERDAMLAHEVGVMRAILREGISV